MNNIENLFNLIKIESPSYQEEEISNHLVEKLETLDFKVQKDDFKNIIAKRINNRKSPVILLSMHMDTVEKAIGANPQVKDDYIVGDMKFALGLDDKVGISSVLTVLEKMKKENIDSENLVININRCEEVGLLGSKKLDYSLLDDVDFGYVLDATGRVGTVINQAPGKIIEKATFFGLSAHAGFEPEKGISAIQMASRAINNMNLLRIDEETTANVGTFESKSGTNVVSERACIKWEARSRNLEKLIEVDKKLKNNCKESALYYNGDVVIEEVNSYNPYKLTEDENSIKYFKKKYKGEVQFKATGGGSDCNNYRDKGIDAVVLAIGYNYPHSEKESISLKELDKLENMIFDLIKR